MGKDYLRRLRQLLIPKDLNADTLIIAPHGSLHALPFHALMDGEEYLIERHAVIYTPGLQALQALFDQNAPALNSALVVGLSNFGNRMPPLAMTGAEIEKILALFPERRESLWADRATKKKLLEWSAAGELKKFSLLHFATHAIFDTTSAHQSRLYLYDDELTTLDILDLTLKARLVTLSGCQTAMGQGGSGDEALSLARAFFYAGASALLASLWRVEDRSVAELIGRFYQQLVSGKNIAAALRQAQIEMIHAGKNSYEWAPFVLIGRP